MTGVMTWVLVSTASLAVGALWVWARVTQHIVTRSELDALRGER